MSAYDARGLMLDPGRTALALRGLHEPDGHYPFIDRFRPRRSKRRVSISGTVRRTVSPWRHALQWLGIARENEPASREAPRNLSLVA
jgi:hypothetical protein